MKLKYEFVVRNVADKTVAIVVSENANNFNGMLTLNESGAFIFERLREETSIEEIIAEFLKEYDATREEAEKTISQFIDKLNASGLLE